VFIVNQDGSQGGQVHDFNPGIEPFPGGVFWTKRIESNQGHVDLEDGEDEGEARLNVTDMALEDYHDLVNALMDGHSQEASVAFDVRWVGNGGAFEASSADFSFTGVKGTASIEWSGRNESGFQFHSNPGNTTSVAILGRERNGVFRSAEDDDQED
jgi:hypothetical protein